VDNNIEDTNKKGALKEGPLSLTNYRTKS